jgi:hypothetical protein
MKHIDNRKPQISLSNVQKKEVGKKEESKQVPSTTDKKNNDTIKEQVMTTSEKIAMAQEVLNSGAASGTKRIKKDKGLIERTESSKTILTEDNKELLND